MNINFVGLIFISICTGQFIFAPSKTICKFDLKDKTLEIISEPIVITVKSRQLVIAISPCKHFKRLEKFSQTQNPKIIRTCNSNSRACISDISVNKSLINAGDRFVYTEIEEDGSDKERVLISMNGDICRGNKSYEVIIHFDCRGITPSYIPPIDEDADSCTYRVRMMAPYCTPHCILRIGAQFVNLNILKKLPDMVVPIGDDKKAVLSMCRPTASCDSANNIVACEIQSSLTTNDNITISALGTFSTEKIFWDENNQQIYFKSQIGTKKNNRHITEIRLVCNWNETNKARIIKSTSKIVVFEVESKFGCVKTVPNCKAKSFKGLSYNLENLYKLDNWLFNDSSSKKISLNICGPLKTTQDSFCRKAYSQICDEMGSINYGSIMKQIHVDQYDKFLSTTFIGGSACSSNISQYYSTNIKFICSLKQNPPKFINIVDCCLNIIWETPEACPKYIVSGTNCKMSNVYYEHGLLDLNRLHTSVDRSVSLSQSLSLRFNFCGKLTSPCNNVSEVSMCLVNNGHEAILGQENADVIFVDGTIRSYFYNSYDFVEEKPNVNVSFICNHKQPIDGAVSIYSVQENVAYQMTVETPLACYTSSTYPCFLTYGNYLYDLTPLMKNDSNYVLSTDQFTMQMNICRPILTNSQTLCDLNSLACLQNLTEPSLANKRYLSLGRNQEIVFDNGLSIKYTSSTICTDFHNFYMETTILFTCSTNEEADPVLIQNNSCNRTINWRTKYACPKKFQVQKRHETECLIQITDKILYNFTALRKHTIEIELEKNSSIKLNICNRQYSLNSESLQQSGVATRKLIHKENIVLQYTLVNNYTINLILQCERNQMNEGYEFNSSSWLDKKTFNFILKNLEVCDKNITERIQYTAAPVVITELELTIAPEANQLTVPSKGNCVVTTLSFQTLDLNSLKPVHVQTLKHSYYIDFNNTNNCKTYVCRDNIPFDKFINFECPNYKLDDDIVHINFALLNDSACKTKDLTGLQLILKCSDEEKNAVIQESDCYVMIHQQTSSICSYSDMILTVRNNTEDNFKYKLGIIIILSILLCFALVFTIRRYLRKKRRANVEFVSFIKQE